MGGLKKLQRRLGHASFATTAHYLQFGIEGESKEIEEIFGEEKTHDSKTPLANGRTPKSVTP
jgi:hypothetical protein